MLRYGFRELLLVQPGAVRFRPPADPDDPDIRAAIARAALDRAAGRRFGDWTEEEHRAWLRRPHALEAAARYAMARAPETLVAPPPWPQELALVTADTLVAAAGAQLWPVRLGSLPAAIAFAAGLTGTQRLRTRAERRQARRLGLTAATAPLPRTGGTVVWALAAVGADAALWRDRPARYPWMLESAASAIRNVNRHRAWRAAYGR